VRSDLSQQITDKLLDLMEKHGSDWRRPWLGDGLAKNIISKRSYRGINIPILGLAHHASPFWGTYKQWAELGAQVRKGEKATGIFFWKPLNIKDRETEEDKQILMARSYAVFNLDQVDNAPILPTETRTRIERHEAFDRIIAATGASITYGGDRAAYVPSQDRIVMPKADQFKTTEGFCGVLAHEVSHWSGAPHRLNRDLSGRFGNRAYALEELVAETSSALTCIAAGVIPEPRPESAKYLNNWIEAMREDKRIIVSIFSKAQAATDFILEFSQQTAEPTRPNPAPQTAAETGNAPAVVPS
jgi:antirestriction protein ArdC